MPISVRDFELRARDQLSREVWESVQGGADDEVTLRSNVRGFRSIRLRPFRLIDVREIELATSVLGERIAFPVLTAPAGVHRLVHPDGELATARAAAAMNTIMCLATGSSYSIEEVASVSDCPKWFQLYHLGCDYSEMLIQRAETAGYKAIVVTVDVPLPYETKEKDRRNSFNPFEGIEQANFLGPAAGVGLVAGSAEARSWVRPPFQPFGWNELDWMRSRTNLPIVVKGILTSEDAAECARRGVNGVIVSNHGGRAIDATVSSIDVLAQVVAAVDGRCEVYIDGGIRRGSDVVKALALGARACLIGRPFLWGLAVAGEDGVRRVLGILRDEIEHTLAFCGRTDVQCVGTDLIHPPTHGAAQSAGPSFAIASVNRLDGVDYLREVPEASAVGCVSEIYDEIRSAFGLPFVNLIYRHLAITPEVLEHVWGALRPLLLSRDTRTAASEFARLNPPRSAVIPAAVLAAVGVQTEELSRILATVNAYNQANSRNLLALTVLLEARERSSIRTKLAAAEEFSFAHHSAPLLPMLDLAELDPAVIALLEEMSIPITGSRGPLIVPSLLRHLAHRPALLGLLWTVLKEPLAAVPEEADALIDRARQWSTAVSFADLRLDQPTTQTVERFRDSMARMVLCGRMIESALTSGVTDRERDETSREV